MPAFAFAFINGRLVGFEKHMRICLTSVELPETKKTTAAYFPVLGACCSTLEYLVNLHRGNLSPAGHRQVANFAQHYLPQPDFDAETVRVLFQAFRHPVAHRGIASGVWIDRQPGQNHGQRLVWATSERSGATLPQQEGPTRRTFTQMRAFSASSPHA